MSSEMDKGQTEEEVLDVSIKFDQMETDPLTLNEVNEMPEADDEPMDQEVLTEFTDHGDAVKDEKETGDTDDVVLKREVEVVESDIRIVSVTVADKEEESTQVIDQDDLNEAIAAAVQEAISGEEEDLAAQEHEDEEADEDGIEKEAIVAEAAEVQEELNWNQNNCIICNVDLDEQEDGGRKDMSWESKMKLRKFFCEYMGVSQTLDMADDDFVPFCNSCSGDIDKLVSLACKIEFMDAQFEKLRDTLARKTVKTYLYRTKPELLDEKAELVPDTSDEPLDVAQPTRLSHPADLLFNNWKRQYDMIIPGRFKKFPVLMKALDSRQRVSYYRIDNAGNHHFIAAVEPNGTVGASEESRVQKLKRVVPTIIQVGTQAPGNKKMKLEEEVCVEGAEVETEGESAGRTRRSFQCMECPKSYPSKSLLKYHTRSHSGEKPYKCTSCDKAFAQRGGLATHLLVHSGEKPYSCEECGKNFRQKYHLTQHKFIHSGVKPFQCDVCDKRFNVKMNLKEHMRRHTGDRPYRCDFCDTVGFFRKKKLRDHVVRAHPNVPLPDYLINVAPTKTDKEESLSSSQAESNHDSDTENKDDDNDNENEPSPTDDDDENHEENIEEVEEESDVKLKREMAPVTPRSTRSTKVK